MDNNFSQYQTLIDTAKTASTHAHAPYSGYKVGAALLTKNGDIFTGCNIENASYPAGICAERVAIHNAISKGEKDFTAIAIYCNSDILFAPCGICRQVMAEFASDLVVIYANDTQTMVSSLAELLPSPFGL